MRAGAAMSMPEGNAAAASPAEAGRESVLRVVVRTLRESPDTARLVKWGFLMFVLMVVIQIIDVRSRSGPPVVAELLGSLSGFTGGFIAILARVLQKAGEEPCSKTAAAGLRPARAVPPQVVQALPTMWFIAGTLVSFGIANYVLRGVLGTSVWFVTLVSLVFLGVLLFGAHAVTDMTRFLYRAARDQAELAARAEAQAAEAQLATLQAQMNPHFLFNALNTVVALVGTDPPAAERMIENLSEVLRKTMGRSRNTVETLGEEIEFLEAYLTIEQERLGARLRVEWAIAPDAPSVRVPPLTLQPLVENALKHGIGARLEGGTLRIGAERAGHAVRLTVEDDGEGFSPGYRERTGLGNLRARLATLYGDRATLRVEPRTRGVRVVVEIPATDGPG